MMTEHLVGLDKNLLILILAMTASGLFLSFGALLSCFIWFFKRIVSQLEAVAVKQDNIKDLLLGEIHGLDKRLVRLEERSKVVATGD